SGLAAAALGTEAAHHPLLERLYPGRAITFPLLYAECGLPESADAVARVRRELLAVVGRSGRARRSEPAPRPQVSR
ncbi:MAG: hypothetical protein ACRET2_12265, partial [Steroidobacteraceae bacterium]